MKQERQLEPFLPSVEELDEMSLSKFSFWVGDAKDILKRREEERNPLSHLKQEISEVLKEDSFSEIEKEKKTHQAINRYYRKYGHL